MFLTRIEALSRLIEQCEITSLQGMIDAEEGRTLFQKMLRRVYENEGIVYVIGNGGSAGIAAHFATDLLRTLEMPATTLSDANMLTCFANDFGYSQVYALPLERNLRAHDLLVAISSSGQSENILNACNVAQEKGAPSITLSGFSFDNPLRKMGDLNFWLESCDYGLVETGHFSLLHTVVDTFSLAPTEYVYAGKD